MICIKIQLDGQFCKLCDRAQRRENSHVIHYDGSKHEEEEENGIEGADLLEKASAGTWMLLHVRGDDDDERKKVKKI